MYASNLIHRSSYRGPGRRLQYQQYLYCVQVDTGEREVTRLQMGVSDRAAPAGSSWFNPG